MTSINSQSHVIHNQLNYYRNSSGHNLEQFSNALLTTDFVNIYSHKDVGQALGDLLNILFFFLYWTNFSVSRSGSNWVTAEIIRASNHLKNLYWLAKNIGDDNFQVQYKLAKLQYVRMPNQSKRNFYTSPIINPKLFGI